MLAGILEQGRGWAERSHVAAVALFGVLVGQHCGPFWQLGNRRGVGCGGASTPSLSFLAGNLAQAVKSSRGWHLWLLLNSSVAIATVWGRLPGARHLPPRRTSWVVFAATGMMACYLLALRHLEIRYLLPTGLSAVIFFSAAGRVWARHPWARAVIPLVAGLLLAKTMFADARAHLAPIAEEEGIRREIERVLVPLRDEKPGLVVAYSY